MATRTQTQTQDLTTNFPNIPPFPENIPTAPLHILHLRTLQSTPNRNHNPTTTTAAEESQRLFDACQDLGFFYLDLRDDAVGERILEEAEDLFGVGEELFELGRQELNGFDYKERGSYMGYKGMGAAVVDERGNLDRNEFYNIPKDDFLNISQTPLPHPQILHYHRRLIQAYMRDAHAVVLLILEHLNTHLHLPPGTLQSLHRQSAISGDQVRLIKAPPQPPSDRRTALGKHTDFGSITLLFNRLGGLQILEPDSASRWLYVRPLPGHCIVNLGDALVKFTNGLLRSNVHRVVSPPGDQAAYTRYSLVYFARPEDRVLLRRLEGGDVIPELKDGEREDVVSSKDWINFQAMRLRRVEALDPEERRKLWDASGRGR